MATLDEITIHWTGMTGLPGSSHLYVDQAVMDGPTATSHVTTWLTNNAGYFPASLTAQVDSTGLSLNSATGALAGTWSISPAPSAVVGSGANAAAGGAGACMRWTTGAVSPGNRFIVGRTFLVPLATGAYGSDGTLSSFCQGDLISHGNTLISDLTNAFVIWTRPVSGAGGVAHTVVGAQVTDQAARLRSRRQ